MRDIILLVIFLAAAVVYRFRAPILARLRQFDARNAARRADEIRDRHDRFAHYRRAVLTAEESLEEVQAITVHDERTGALLKRYLFLGDTSRRATRPKPRGACGPSRSRASSTRSWTADARARSAQGAPPGPPARGPAALAGPGNTGVTPPRPS